MLAPERKLKMLQSHIVNIIVLKLVNFLFFNVARTPRNKNAQPDLENGGKLITTFAL